MVKNSRMFKDRFDEIYREMANQISKDRTRLTQDPPSDDTIAQLILIEIEPTLKKVVEENLSEGCYSAANIDDILLEQYPAVAKNIKNRLIKESKTIRTKDAKNLEHLSKLHMELRDKVLFNGLDPLEAIETLKAFKEE